MREVSFQPKTALGGPHAQTLWSYLIQSAPKAAYVREQLETRDGDYVDLDWMDVEDKSAPICLVLHGLEGSSKAPYVRRIAQYLKERGFGALALNSRGCSGRDNRKVQAYHAGWTKDLIEVVSMVTSRYPGRPIALVGYSLGASQMANYLGRHADAIPEEVRAAYLVSAPIALGRAIGQLDAGLNRMYSSKFLTSLRKKLVGKAWSHPEVRSRALKGLFVMSVRAFDEGWTAPINGFENAMDYYEKSSCEPWLSEVRVPTTFLHAKDDPLIPWHAVIGDWQKEAPCVGLEWTERGGHVGFAAQGAPNWLEERIYQGLLSLGWTGGAG
jgi:hypothetical protein